MAILGINVNEYPIVEAKDQLPRLIREAEAGNPVMVTRHGKPAAVLLSAVRYEQLTAHQKDFLGAVQEFKAQYRVAEDLGDVFGDVFGDVRDASIGRDVNL
jgi:prevent-host-death family protein